MLSLLSSNLQAFKAVTETGTVHGAASKIGLSQTAVTQRIRVLERELGSSLFQRSRKGMRLTHEGQALFNYCQQTQEIEGKVLAVFSESGLSQDVEMTLVGPTSTLVTRIPEQSIELFKSWPKLNLHFIFNDEENCINYLKTGKAQFAILKKFQVSEELESKALEPEQFVLVAPYAWKDRSIKTILKDERMIDFFENDKTTLDYLNKHKLLKNVSRPRLFVNNNKSLIDLVCNQVGYATLSKKIADPYVKEKKLIILNQGKSLDVEIALAWYPRAECPGYFAEIIKMLR